MKTFDFETFMIVASICSFVLIVIPIFGMVMASATIKRARNSGRPIIFAPPTDPIGGRSSTISEERLSAWIDYFVGVLVPFGIVVGLAGYPFVASWWYGGAERPMLLPVVSGVCLIGAIAINFLTKGDKSSGCLPLLFVAVVVTIGFKIAGIQTPGKTWAWLFLLIGSLFSGYLVAFVSACGLGAYSALRPAFKSPGLTTVDGKKYSGLAAVRDLIGFVIAAPLFAIIKAIIHFNSDNKAAAEQDVDPNA